MPEETPPVVETPQAIGTESSLSNWAGPYVTDILGKGKALAEMPYQGYYGPLSAGESSLQSDAFGGIAGLTLPPGFSDESRDIGRESYMDAYNAGQYDPTTFGDTGSNTYDPTAFGTGNSTFNATDFNTNSWDSDQASQYMNPFMGEVLNPQLAEIARQSQIQKMTNDSRLTKAGAYGGSRQAIMDSEQDDNMMRLMAELTGKGYRDAYDSAGKMFTSDSARSLEADRASEQSRQFGSSQEQADYERQLAAQRAGDSSRQFGAGLEQSDFERRFAADKASEQSRQFGASQGLAGIDRQLAAGRDILDANQTGFDAQRDIFGDQLDAGAIQRGITSEGIAADKAQFEEERDFPYKQLQYQHSLLNGMPLAAQNTAYQQPGTFASAISGGAGLQELYESIFGGGSSGSGGTSLSDLADLDWNW